MHSIGWAAVNNQVQCMPCMGANGLVACPGRDATAAIVVDFKMRRQSRSTFKVHLVDLQIMPMQTA